MLSNLGQPFFCLHGVWAGVDSMGVLSVNRLIGQIGLIGTRKTVGIYHYAVQTAKDTGPSEIKAI